MEWLAKATLGCIETQIGCIEKKVRCIEAQLGCIEIQLGCTLAQIGCIEIQWWVFTSIQCHAMSLRCKFVVAQYHQ